MKKIRKIYQREKDKIKNIFFIFLFFFFSTRLESADPSAAEY
jgi:hypothetical protein